MSRCLKFEINHDWINFENFKLQALLTLPVHSPNYIRSSNNRSVRGRKQKQPMYSALQRSLFQRASNELIAAVESAALSDFGIGF